MNQKVKREDEIKNRAFARSDDWTEILSPKTRLLDLHLREVWRYRDLMFLLIKRDFASQYKQTILGPLWHIVQPVFTTIMFLIVFNKIAKIPTDTLPPLLFYMSSITIWNYFAACLNSTSTTFTTNAGIFGKVYFPRLVMPLSSVLSNIIKFGIQFALLLAMIVYYSVLGIYSIEAGWHMLLIPVIIIIMAGMGLGLGIIITSLTTKYRDLAVLVTFGVQLLMYITPVAYPLSYVEHSKFTNFIRWNPLTPMVESFRYAVLGQGTLNIYFFIYSIICAVTVIFAGVLLFNKVERNFMDTI